MRVNFSKTFCQREKKIIRGQFENTGFNVTENLRWLWTLCKEFDTNATLVGGNCSHHYAILATELTSDRKRIRLLEIPRSMSMCYFHDQVLTINRVIQANHTVKSVLLLTWISLWFDYFIVNLVSINITQVSLNNALVSLYINGSLIAKLIARQVLRQNGKIYWPIFQLAELVFFRAWGPFLEAPGNYRTR